MTEEALIAYCRKHSNDRMPAYSGLCGFCGEVFWSAHFFPNALYCSRQCCGKDRAGNKSPAWKGGRWITSSGYIQISNPQSDGSENKGILEHRSVMESVIGRKLKITEAVHHKNGIKSDNRPENLELWARAQPSGQRVEDLISWVCDNYNKEIRAKLEIQDLVRSVIARLTIKREGAENSGL